MNERALRSGWSTLQRALIPLRTWFGQALHRLREPALVLAVLVATFGAVQVWDFALPAFGASEYQAVFLVNGQTYFGRYSDRLGPYVRVLDAYYLQQEQTEEGGATPPQIVRRGGELHGPLPRMLIPRSQVLFVEDLAPSSAVVDAMRRDGAGR